MDGMTATTPFLEFRLWWRRASAGKQSAAVGALATVMALIVWIAVPLAGGGPSTNLGAGSNGRGLASSGQGSLGTGTAAVGPGAAAGPGATTATAATGPAAGPTGTAGAGPGGTAGTGGTAGGVAGGAAGGCSGPAKNLTVGVVLINVGDGSLNSTAGIPSADGQHKTWDAMFDSINKSGGAGCNHLTPYYQTYDQFQQSTATSTCLAFVQQKVFSVLNGYLPMNPDTCVLQNHIPLFEEVELSSKDLQQFYPYYFSVDGQLQVVYRNWAYASRQLNMFNPANGFKKLGIFYRDCQPEVNAAMLADLQAVGVPPSAIDRADLGCPTSFASPSAIEQAVVKFKSDGVTMATIDNDISDTQNITKQSQAQGFRPQWTIPDYGTVVVTGNANFAPDPSNFNNALAITPEQIGASNTPGFKESPTDVQCDQIMTSHGQQPVVQSADNFTGGVCDITWTFVAALNHAPTVAPDQLAAGLQRAGSVPFSIPFGPNNFSAQGTTTGGQFWRPVRYHSSCGCWQTDNPNFQPSF